MLIKLEGHNRTLIVEAAAVEMSTIKADADAFANIESDEYQDFLFNCAVGKLGDVNGYVKEFGDIDDRSEISVLKVVGRNMEASICLVFGGYTILNDAGIVIEDVPDYYNSYFGGE